MPPVAASRAVAGLCLTSEANLGGGFFPAREGFRPTNSIVAR